MGKDEADSYLLCGSWCIHLGDQSSARSIILVYNRKPQGGDKKVLHLRSGKMNGLLTSLLEPIYTQRSTSNHTYGISEVVAWKE